MTQPTETLTAAALVLYTAALLFYSSLWWKSVRFLRVLAPTLLGLGLFVNLYQLIDRWVETAQPPFKTLYECMILLATCIALVYLIIEGVYRARILGLPSAFGCAATMLYAFLQQDKDVVNLPPALQSGWFIPHVVVYFFAYASLFVASAASFVSLLRPKPIRVGRADLVPGQVIDLEALLDGAVRFGFALLSLGLLMGAVWAKAAWGDYWGWDPKETWSLVTWLVFGAYLHLHYLGGWRGRRLAVLVLIGFGAVMFTYLGMNLLPAAEQSAHVYQ